MVIQTFKRYELKYFTSEAQAAALLDTINAHMSPDAYCTDGRYYTIYNVYLDNENSELIRTSLQKPYYKEKLRMRSYSPSPGPDDAVFLEIKKKIGRIVSKRRAVLSYAQALDYLEHRHIPVPSDFMQRQVLAEIDTVMERMHPFPMVNIRYDRTAFFDREDPSLRVTFDRNILTRRESPLFGNTDGTPLLSDDRVLMEIKTSGVIPLWLVRELTALDIRRTNFSKYGAEFNQFLLAKARTNHV